LQKNSIFDTSGHCLVTVISVIRETKGFTSEMNNNCQPIKIHNMKQLFVVALSMMLILQLSAQQSGKKFAIKSGKLEYKLTGNTTGTKTIYFDDYGDKYFERLVSLTETKMFGVTDKSETNKTTIINDGHFWTVNKITNNNVEGVLPFYSSSKALFNSMTEKEQKEFADDILESFGGTHEGVEKVLGYTCEKIAVMGSVLWIYKGVALKSEAKIMGITANETATSFEMNINISSSQFEAPVGVEFVNLEQQQSILGDVDMEMYQDEDSDADEVIPVDYPFDKFKVAINSFNPEGYKRTMVMSQEGQHFAIYTKGGFADVLSVVATSMKNTEGAEEFSNFEIIKHNGKTMKYGNLDDEDSTGKVLLIPFDDYDMYIILMSAPGKDKLTLLDWSDKLDF